MYQSYSNKEAWEGDRKAVIGGVRTRELMERAGEALAGKVAAAMDRLGAKEALFVLGEGNNAGDGFVAARILSEQGRDVKALCLSDKFSPKCAIRAKFLREFPKRLFPSLWTVFSERGSNDLPKGNMQGLFR